MPGVNKAIILGSTGRDPEVRRTPSGTSVATFSVATNESYTDKQNNKQDKTEWHNVVCWGKLAEIVGQYLKKGRTVYVEGSLITTSWEDKNGGGKRYKTEIKASTVQFISKGVDRDDRPQESFPSQDSFPSDIPNNTTQGMDDDLPF